MSAPKRLTSSIFPAYAPPKPDVSPHEHAARYVEAVGRRMSAIVGLFVLVLGAGAWFGFAAITPKDTRVRLDSTVRRVDSLERDTARLRQDREDDRFVTCKILEVVNPKAYQFASGCKKS